jgi:hypothetical protein
VRGVNAAEMSTLRMLGLPALFVLNRSAMVATAKAVFKRLSKVSSTALPTEDDVLERLTVELLAMKAFTDKMQRSGHTLPKFYDVYANAFARHIIEQAWGEISA